MNDSYMVILEVSERGFGYREHWAFKTDASIGSFALRTLPLYAARKPRSGSQPGEKHGLSEPHPASRLQKLKHGALSLHVT